MEHFEVKPLVLSGESSSDDGGRLIRGASLRLLGYAAMVVLSVVSTAVVTRNLGVSRFGQYTTVISVTSLVILVTDSGMTNITSREYALLDGEQRERVLSSLLGLRICLTAVGTAASIGFAFAAHYGTALLLGMLVASIATFPLIVLHTVSIPLTNDLRLGALSMLELARQALWAGGLIALSLAGAGVFPLLATLLLANLLLIPVTLRVTSGLSRVSLRMRFSGWRGLMKTTFVFSVGTAVGTIYLYGTQVITSLVTTHHQTGLFSLGFRIFLVTYNIPVLVGSAAVPLLARAGRDDQDRLAYVLRRYLEISCAGGLGVAMVLSAASGFVIPLIAGPGFRAAIHVAEIQSFALVGTFVSAPCSYGLLTLELYRRLLAANATALVVMVVATEALARAHGATGAATASICGEMAAAVLMLAGLLQRQPDCRPPLIFVAKLLVAFACAAPFAFASWLPSLPRACAAAVVYTMVVVLSRALPDEVMQMLPVLRWGAWGR